MSAKLANPPRDCATVVNAQTAPDSRQMSFRLPILAGTALVACACSPITITDRTEIETHREFEMAPLRGADECLNEIWLELGHYAAPGQLTLRVSPSGHAHVVAMYVNNEPAEAPPSNAACLQHIQSAIADWRYRPFTRYGVPSVARVTERIVLLPAERWRTPRRPFPAIADITEVSITLRRREDLYICQGDRPASYDLELRGDGGFILKEFIDANVASSRVREGAVDAVAFADLVEQFRHADFFSLEEEYRGGWTHQTSQILIVAVGDERAEVVDYIGESAGMPLVVRELQDAVDRAAGLDPPPCSPNEFLRQALNPYLPNF